MDNPIDFYVQFAFFGILSRDGVARAQQFAVKYKLAPEVQNRMARIRIQELMTGEEGYEDRAAGVIVKRMANVFGFESVDLQIMAQEVYMGTLEEGPDSWPENRRKVVSAHVQRWFMDGAEDSPPEISTTDIHHFGAVGKLIEQQSQEGDRVKRLVSFALCSGRLLDPELNRLARLGRIPSHLLNLMREAGVIR